MKSVGKLSRSELAAFVAEHLRQHGIDVVLTGGSCVSIYSNDLYVSKDLDFIDISLQTNRRIGQVLGTIGFENSPKNSRHFAHCESKWTIEFPSAPLTIGDERVEESALAEIETELGLLKLLSPTDCVKDRLANYIYFADKQCLQQAILVASEQLVDFEGIKRWCEDEGMSAKYEDFIEGMKAENK